MFELFFRQLIEKEGYKLVLQGLQTTLLIAIIGLAIGLVFGSILSVFELLPGKGIFTKIANGFAQVYVALFRGTPLVVQLLITHFVLFPSIGISIDPAIEGSIAFGLNSSAYVCEIMRGGINSVDKGQMEAGRALGLGYGKTMIKIVIPQAIKNVIPTLGNEFITLVKDTSVVGYIAINDVTKSFQAIAGATYEYIVPYLALAVVYLVIVLIVTLIIKFIERRLAASDRR